MAKKKLAKHVSTFYVQSANCKEDEIHFSNGIKKNRSYKTENKEDGTIFKIRDGQKIML
jgi:hypothetical protein